MSTSICIFFCQLDHKVGRLNRRTVPHVEKFTRLHTSLSVEGYSQRGSIADHDNWMVVNFAPSQQGAFGSNHFPNTLYIFGRIYA